MIKKNCADCGCVIEEYDEFEAYEEDGTDAVWDDTKKRWICQSCKDYKNRK